MNRLRQLIRARRERGASTVIFALLVPVLFGAAALALDVATLAHERQELSNALDAAALAGASKLPGDPTGAAASALAYAAANDPEADPVVSFWCIVASTGSAKTVNVSQIPSVCNPGTVVGARCDEYICAIPCPPGGGNKCNTMHVVDEKDVEFAVGPVIGLNSGTIGSASATACKGPCGTLLPNPMDVVFVADRTGSMSTANRDLMVSAIKSTLQTMTKEQQYVALGTIHRSSATPGSCITTPSGSPSSGPWIPVPFSDSYTGSPATPGATPPLNAGSSLVSGLNCLSASSQGTYLAAPLKAAARYVLGLAPNNLGSLPAREGTVRKAIIFETDGNPNESNIAGSTSLGSASDLGTSDGGDACNNMSQVAGNAKAQGVLIVTVGFGAANTAQCEAGGQFVRNVLAAAASPDPDGNPSAAENDCSNATERAAENSDGDFYFCPGTGSELGPIFSSAINQLSTNSRLLRIPE